MCIYNRLVVVIAEVVHIHTYHQLCLNMVSREFVLLLKREQHIDEVTFRCCHACMVIYILHILGLCTHDPLNHVQFHQHREVVHHVKTAEQG